MHLPTQAAFALSVAGVAVLAVLAGAAKSAWWQVSAWSAAVSALWLGLLSVAYPGHLGSVGRIGGVAAIVWGCGTRGRHRDQSSDHAAPHRPVGELTIDHCVDCRRAAATRGAGPRRNRSIGAQINRSGHPPHGDDPHLTRRFYSATTPTGSKTK
jgi:hypothetical protein